MSVAIIASVIVKMSKYTARAFSRNSKLPGYKRPCDNGSGNCKCATRRTRRILYSSNHGLRVISPISPTHKMVIPV